MNINCNQSPLLPLFVTRPAEPGTYCVKHGMFLQRIMKSLLGNAPRQILVFLCLFLYSHITFATEKFVPGVYQDTSGNQYLVAGPTPSSAGRSQWTIVSTTSAPGTFAVAESSFLAGATASLMEVNPAGVGHMLVVPYFSAQSGKQTLLNITNTDPVNGKAVKIRFRSASNGDDMFDFQVFLAPGDEWSSSISLGADGRAGLVTADPSCQKPNLKAYGFLSFSTVRLDPTAIASVLASDTREGFAEIINMADIPPGTALFTAINPVAGVAPCSGAAWNQLDNGFETYEQAYAAGLRSPSTGLKSEWIIFDPAVASSFAGQALALQANTGALSATGQPVPGLGNIVYWSQTNAPLALTGLGTFTADPLLLSGAYSAGQYDLPDLSTPYVQAATPVVQAAQLSAAIATTSVSNEFQTNSLINASTDWVFSMPTRRYSVAFNYSSGTRQYSVLPVNYFTSANTTVSGRKVCLSGITGAWYGQQNSTPQAPISMNGFCGNVSVLTFNGNSGALNSSAGLMNLFGPTDAGWVNLQTPGFGNGLPVVGGAFIRSASGGGTFGTRWEHRYTH